MKPIPVSLGKCPLRESVFELRFSTDLPDQAVFGVIYHSIIESVKTFSVTQTPISQIPDAIRNTDPNLLYQPHYRLVDNNHSLNIGPRSLMFSVQAPYPGWNNWRERIIPIISQISKLGILKQIERTGLRYINFFDESLFDISEIELTIIKNRFSEQSTVIRSEIKDGDFTKVLQLSSNVQITTEQGNQNGSVIDLDIIKDYKGDNSKFDGAITSILEASHEKEKELFFNLLCDDFIKSLEPKYEDAHE